MSKRSSDELARDRDSEVDAQTIEGKAVCDKGTELDPEKGLSTGTDVDSVPKANTEKPAKHEIQAWTTLVGAYVLSVSIFLW